VHHQGKSNKQQAVVGYYTNITCCMVTLLPPPLLRTSVGSWQLKLGAKDHNIKVPQLENKFLFKL